MADWDLSNNETAPLDPKYEDIQALFLSGKIKRMYNLVNRSPTKVAQLLNLNYQAYHEKLANPEKFTVFHINILAYTLQIDPNIIFDIIQKEIREKIRAGFQKQKKA